MISLVKKYLGRDGIFAAATFITTCLTYFVQICLLMPESKRMTDSGVDRQDTDMIRHCGMIMIIFTVIIGICNIFNSYFSSKAEAGFTCSVRKACFKKVNSLSPQDMAKFGSSTLLNRTMADTANITLVVINSLRLCLAIPVLILTELIMIAWSNVIIFCILLFFFVLTVTFMVVKTAKARIFFEKVQQKLDRINLNMRERIVGVRHIRAFGNEEYIQKCCAKGNKEAHDASIDANAKIVFLSPVAMVVMNWVVVLISIVGTQQVKRDMASISQLLLIFQYIFYFIVSPYVHTVFDKRSAEGRSFRTKDKRAA